jgi:uncharacterized protein (UPF0332 family)
MLTDAQRQRALDYLSLSVGMLSSVQFSATSNEYDIRNGFSRLYYAFFHVSLGLLIAQGEDIDLFRKNHRMVQTQVNRNMGRYMGTTIADLYRARLQADYEPVFFRSKYGGDQQKAQMDAVTTLQRAKRNFFWIYFQAKGLL